MRVSIRSRAADDLLDLAEYIGRDSVDAAEKFLEAAEATIARVAAFPTSGSLVRLKSPILLGMRVVTIKGFPNHLVFFLPQRSTIEIVRIAHGARDLSGLFADEL